MRYRLSLFILLVGMVLSAYADEVVFQTVAPKQAIVGEPFQVAFSVNAQGTNMRAPQITDFEILSGPYTSTSSSTSFVNGKRTSSFEQRYTYVFKALKEGTFTIPPATIKVNGKDYQSNGVRIEVLPADKKPAQQNPQQQSVSSGEIFVRTIVSKTKVHEQEAISLTYRLYFANLQVTEYIRNPELPSFTGFLKEDIKTSEQANLEHYNGKNYQVIDLFSYVLFPQKAGEIVIDPAHFAINAQERVRVPSRNPFEEYREVYRNVPHELEAKGVKINVESLPTGKPAGFSGAVGSFSLKSSVTQTQMNVNDAFTLKLTLSGEGNMKLIKTPSIEWPEGFEVYDAQVSNNYSITSSGFKGTKTIEYPVIARYGGEYTIPAVTFSYFDLKENAYKTLRTETYTIRIANTGQSTAQQSNASSPAVINYAQPQQNLKVVASDIRPIHASGNWQQTKTRHLIEYGSLEFWLCYFIPLGIAFLLLIILRKRIKENADLTRVRYKRANKVAQKRLKAARLALKANNKDAFYAEIEKAAWTYLSDRLTIPTAELNKENISTLLREKNVDDTLIADVMNVLSTAEFARYAPTTDHDMEDLYKATTNLINHLEDQKI